MSIQVSLSKNRGAQVRREKISTYHDKIFDEKNDSEAGPTKLCPIYGRYEVETFSFGRQYFIALHTNEYLYHFKFVDETTKTIQFFLNFELIDH